jgi:hypothetical protein
VDDGNRVALGEPVGEDVDLREAVLGHGGSSSLSVED